MFATAFLLTALAPSQPVPRWTQSNGYGSSGQPVLNPARLEPATRQEPPPKPSKIWELRITAPRLAEPMLVGERLGSVEVTVILKNVSGTDQRAALLDESNLIQDILNARIMQPDGQEPGRTGKFPGFGVDFKKLPRVAAGKELTARLQVSRFGYHHLDRRGKHTLVVTYADPSGTATSNTIEFMVYNPEIPTVPPEARNPAVVLTRKPLPLLGNEKDRLPNELSRASLDQIRIGNRTYLYYRFFLGPRYSSVCNLSARLAELPGVVELVSVGGYGSDEPLVIAYPHKPDGITTLRVDSLVGEIEERLTFETKIPDDTDASEALFKDMKFKRVEDIPPVQLRLTYAAFVAAVKRGDVAKFCLPNVADISDKEDPKRGEYGIGMNVLWMKKHFKEHVLGCARHSDDTFALRTASSSLFWIQTRSGEWKLYKYEDKPIE